MARVKEDHVVYYGDLEIEEDMPSQRRLWKVQSFGRALAGIILLAALLGAFGDGLLSTTKKSNQVLSVSYDRVWFRDTPLAVKIHIFKDQIKGGLATLTLNTTMASYINYDEISPQPKSVKTINGKTVLEFAVEQPTEDLMIDIGMEKDDVGFLISKFSTDGSDPLVIKQLYLP